MYNISGGNKRMEGGKEGTHVQSEREKGKESSHISLSSNAFLPS